MTSWQYCHSVDGFPLTPSSVLSVVFLVHFSLLLLIFAPSPGFLYLYFFPLFIPPFHWFSSPPSLLAPPSYPSIYTRLSRGQLDAALKHSLHGRSSENLSQDFEEFFLSSADEIADLLRQTPDVSHFKAHQLVCEMVQVRGREGKGMDDRVDSKADEVQLQTSYLALICNFHQLL